jgi:hypothetical protein
MRMLTRLVWTLGRRVGNLRQGDPRSLALQTNPITAPFVASAFPVEAIGIQSITIRADRTSAIIIASNNPLLLVVIGLMSPLIYHPAGVEILMHRMEKGVKAEPGISGHSIHAQIGVMVSQLQKQSSTGHVFMFISWTHIIQEGEAEAAFWVGQAQR